MGIHRTFFFLPLVLAAAVVVLAISNSPALAAARDCGRVTATRDGSSSTYRVGVVRGAVTCTDARAVIKAYTSGKGTLHKPPHGRGSWYTILPGGWSCASGAGGAQGCSRGPKINSYEHRDQVSAMPV